MIWVIAIVALIIALDILLANLPAPVPTNQAVSYVENSSSFKQLVGNGTCLNFIVGALAALSSIRFTRAPM